MSELKAHNINDLSLHDIANCEFYLKYEADKVIAEKDKELRHHKYKRCLAMAILSLGKREYYRAEYEEWCLKWYNRWLKLAEKFK